MQNDIVLFTDGDIILEVPITPDQDTVWLNRSQMAELFGRDIKTIGKHISNARKEELADQVVVAKFATTTKHGAVEGKTQTHLTEYYNLDVIISVGYRIKSKRGIAFRKWANNILKDIYRHLDKGTYSVEHIMPQHLTPQWVSDLGDDYEDIHETWLHRLANLTLTAYNSKYSNYPFIDKRDMDKGFRQSGLRMNMWVANQEKWTLSELEERKELLISRALNIWPLPETTYKPKEKQLDSYSLEDDVDLSGREIVRFGYKNTEQPVDSWITMMAQVLKILHTEDKSVLTRLAHTHNPDDELDSYISDNPSNLRGALEIDQNIYLERNTSTNTKLSVLNKFFKAYGQNPEELVFYLKDQNRDQDKEEAGTRYEIRRRYWAFALEYIKAAHGTEGSFKNVTTSKQYWISGAIGISGFNISCEAKMNKAAVELVLAKSNRDVNKAAYDYLFERKDEIEAELGIPLNWWRFEGKASYVDYNVEGIGINDETSWTQMAKFHAEWSKKFYDVFVPLLQQWNELR